MECIAFNTKYLQQDDYIFVTTTVFFANYMYVGYAKYSTLKSAIYVVDAKSNKTCALLTMCSVAKNKHY